MKKMKEALVAEFDVFAFPDRRCRDVDLINTFYVDGRTTFDLASDKKPYGWFCLMLLQIISPIQVELTLAGNIPANDTINQWIATNNLDRVDKFGRKVVLSLSRSNLDLLDTLASMITDITQLGAPRYAHSDYKYACPRASDAIRRLAMVLRKQWDSQQED